ncbi:MAG TPA: hypothetical protein PK154_03460 [Methanoregulaceae archaeon]|nr:hypothetical protein [Methanoregulaceae archaeon]HPW10153.1 hypothetical protein [Methanoregulaceae archaeon]HQM56158.1 hypothetical protein [Methanoregulaceae archaeon]
MSPIKRGHESPCYPGQNLSLSSYTGLFTDKNIPLHDTNPHPWIFPAHPAKGKYVEGKGSIRIPVAIAGEIRHDRRMVTIVPCHFQERERHLLPNNPDLAWKELGS